MLGIPTGICNQFICPNFSGNVDGRTSPTSCRLVVTLWGNKLTGKGATSPVLVTRVAFLGGLPVHHTAYRKLVRRGVGYLLRS